MANDAILAQVGRTGERNSFISASECMAYEIVTLAPRPQYPLERPTTTLRDHDNISVPWIIAFTVVSTIIVLITTRWFKGNGTQQIESPTVNPVKSTEVSSPRPALAVPKGSARKHTPRKVKRLASGAVISIPSFE